MQTDHLYLVISSSTPAVQARKVEGRLGGGGFPRREEWRCGGAESIFRRGTREPVLRLRRVV